MTESVGPDPAPTPGAETGNRALVVGIGNPTRGDDAAGWVVAARIEDLRLAGVEVRTTQQLGPEWAEVWSQFDRVLVVDAAMDDRQVGFKELSNRTTTHTSQSHGFSAEAIAQLAATLYRRSPRVWSYGIPASCFDFGTGLSEGAAQGVEAATRSIQEWLASDA